MQARIAVQGCLRRIGLGVHVTQDHRAVSPAPEIHDGRYLGPTYVDLLLHVVEVGGDHEQRLTPAQINVGPEKPPPYQQVPRGQGDVAPLADGVAAEDGVAPQQIGGGPRDVGHLQPPGEPSEHVQRAVDIPPSGNLLQGHHLGFALLDDPGQGLYP